MNQQKNSNSNVNMQQVMNLLNGPLGQMLQQSSNFGGQQSDQMKMVQSLLEVMNTQ
jgi:hypothetical protein